MAIFAYLVDDVPYEVQVQLQRQEYLMERAAMSEEEMMEEQNKRKKSLRPTRTDFDPAQFQPADRDEAGEYGTMSRQNTQY